MLPNHIIALPNSDKKFHEKWYDGRNKLDMPHPYRAILVGKPGVGKSTICKNLVLRADPPFESVRIIHADPMHTKEYDDLGNVELSGDILPADEWDSDDTKTLIILDDLEFKGMDKKQLQNLHRLFGYASTHKNISVLLCSQDFFNIPPICKRCSTLFVIWKNQDIDSMNMVAKRCGMDYKLFNSIFKNHITEPRDSLWIDLSEKTKYPIRKNGFETDIFKNMSF
jgi:hypothetical protein